MTSSGEFVKVKAKNKPPSLGEIYSGKVHTATSYPRLSLIAAMLAFCIIVAGGSYTYYVPAATVTIDINPALKLDLNRWNRIIKVSSLNDDGEKMLQGLKLKNKTVDEALLLILEVAKDTDVITEDYNKDGGNISVHISENKAHNIDISKFQQTVEDENLNTTIIRDSGKDNSSKAKDKNSETKTLPNSNKNNNNNNKNTNPKNPGNNKNEGSIPQKNINSDKDKK